MSRKGIIYRGYWLVREQDHIHVIGDSSDWREDTIRDAIEEINKLKGTSDELLKNVRVVKTEAQRRKELNIEYLERREYD